MWKQYRLLGISAIFMVLMVLAACGSGNDNNDGNNNNNNNAAESEDNDNNADFDLGDKDVALGTDDYVSNTANTYVAKLLLEEIGYDVEVNQTDVGVEYAGLSDGSTDVLVGSWLPTTHASYWDEYEDDLEKIDTVTEEVELGLAVPDYMEDIDSIEDLRDNTDDVGDKLNWQITGISPGAGEMKLMESDVMPGYDLESDWELVESSGAAMAASLTDAIDSEEPIVVTLWTPHWTFNKFDLKILDDPKDTFGEPDDILSVSRKGFKEDSPAAYDLIKQFEITKEETQDIMLDIQSGTDEEEAAEQFLEDNPDLKEQWLDGFE